MVEECWVWSGPEDHFDPLSKNPTHKKILDLIIEVLKASYYNLILTIVIDRHLSINRDQNLVIETINLIRAEHKEPKTHSLNL